MVLRRGGRVCSPNIFLDPARQRWAGGDVEQVVLGVEIAALEVYVGTGTPAEFQGLGSPPCGTIVIWTRRD